MSLTAVHQFVNMVLLNEINRNTHHPNEPKDSGFKNMAPSHWYCAALVIETKKTELATFVVGAWPNSSCPPCPPRGRVQGWQSVFWGGTIMFQDLKDSENWSSENTKIPRPSKIVLKKQHILKTIFDLIGFTYVLGLSTIMEDLLRFHHRIFHFYLKRSEIPIVLDPIKQLFMFGAPQAFQIFKHWPSGLSLLIPFFIDPQITKKHVMFCNRYWYHISKMPFMFSVDIGLISKSFKILLDGYSGFFGARLFQTFAFLFEIQNSEICKINTC